MINICVAILLAVVVNTEESDVRYSVSENSDEVLSEDNPVISSNPSEYATQISKTQHGGSHFRNNKPNSASETAISNRRDNKRRQKERIFRIKSKDEDGDTFEGYPNSRTLPINDKTSDDINVKDFHIDSSKFDTQNFKNYRKDSEIIVNNEATKLNLESSITDIPQTAKSKSLDSSIRKANFNEYGQGELNGESYNIPETLTDSQDNTRNEYNESAQIIYAIPKSFNTGYNTQISRKQYGIVTSLERSIGDIYNDDFTVNSPENLNKESIDNYRINIQNDQINSKTNLYDSIADKDNKYDIPKSEENYPTNFHAKITQTNYSPIVKENSDNDQVFDNSNNFEEKFQDYHNYFEDQTFSSNADDINKSYSKEKSLDFDAKDTYGTSRISVSSDDLLRSSPGIAGITQAIIRPHFQPIVQRHSKSSRDHQSYDTHEDFARTNNINSYQNPRNRQLSIGQRGRPGRYTDLERAGKRNKDYNQFGEYPLNRNGENKNIPAVYRFEYAISDKGNDQFGHKESRQSFKTKGSYHVLLPDGRKQIVEYEADEQGFKPRIRYEKIGYAVGPTKGYNDRQSGHGIDKY